MIIILLFILVLILISCLLFLYNNSKKEKFQETDINNFTKDSQAQNRIITDDLELYQARVVLIKAVKIVISNGLNILGISAPKRM